MTVGLVFFCRMQIWFFQNPVLSGLVDFLLLFLFLYIVQRSTHQLVMAISADPKKQSGIGSDSGVSLSQLRSVPEYPDIYTFIYFRVWIRIHQLYSSPKKGFLSLFSPSTQPSTAAALSLSLEIHRLLVATGLCTTGLPSPPIVGMYHAIISPSSYISVLFLIPVDLNRRPTFSIQQQQTVCSIGRT